ncbi:377_t:CDS:2 [Dentiscutata heterogama]|uniref:377_t:CDS:1 n=1 Tax=Dentiscutata heterogama TaxID=1316150 RepID=A0ACA9JXH7_9GLOM|nr:377_t:CDS:2 [Dentiscutata heterogama]
MSHHAVQDLLSRFLSVPRNFRHVQDQRGNHFGFSPFDSDQLRQAQILSDNYFRISRENVSNDPVGKVMAQAQQDAEQYDPELVRYALMVWIVHDPEARKRNLKIPPLGQRAPHIAVPKLVNAAIGAPTSTIADPPLTNLDWWREDPQLNEHHEHWHIVFPAFPVNGVSKDREGENFAFMHRQMLARYDAERIAVGLQPVKALSDFSERIPEAYNPDSDLVYDPNNAPNATNVHFTPRSVGRQLTDLEEVLEDSGISSLKLIETNNSVKGHELQVTNIKVIVNKRKRGSNCTNVKKRTNYEESSLINSNKYPLRSIETNNSVEDHKLQVINIDVISNNRKKSLNHTKAKEKIEIEPSLIDNNLSSKNSAQQRKQVSNASFLFLIIKNTLSYKQQSFSSKASPSFLVRSDSSESIYSE